MLRPTRLLLSGLLLGPLSMSAQALAPDSASPSEQVLLHLPESAIPGLRPLIDAAKDVAPSVIQARLDALAAEEQVQASKAVTRPNAFIYLDGAYRENSKRGNGGFKTYYNVSLEQPLWHWHALDNHKRIIKIQKRLADQDYDEARRSLVLEIRRQYLALLLKKLSLSETNSEFERRQSALAVNRERSRRGEYAADLVASEQLDARVAEVARDRQRAEFQRALRSFAVLNGREAYASDDLLSEVPAIPSSVRALFLPDAPAPVPQNQIPASLARPESDLAVARLNQEIIRVKTYPKLSFATGADQGAASGADQSAVVNYFAGVRVRWNIFDGLATRALVREAKVLVRKNENALAEARIALTRQLSDEAEDLALSLRELDVLEERFNLTSSRLKVDEDLWKSGRLAETEWQTRKASSETERIALYDLRGATLLKLSEHALSRLRATKPSSEILFP